MTKASHGHCGPQECFYTWHTAMSQQGHHNSGGLSPSTTVALSLAVPWLCWGAGNSLWTRLAVTCFCGSKKHLPSDLMHDLQENLHVEPVCPSAQRLCCMMRQPQWVEGVLLLAACPDPEADGCLSRDALLS